MAFKPTAKLEKDGDEYKYSSILPSGTKVTKFKSGVEFEETLKEGLTVSYIYDYNMYILTYFYSRVRLFALNPKGHT